MEPLIDRMFYDRLQAERRRLMAAGRGSFVPVGPVTGGAEPPPRIVFVGQAAYASTVDEVEAAAGLGFEAAAARSADNAARLLLRERRSPCWQAIRAVLARCSGRSAPKIGRIRRA